LTANYSFFSGLRLDGPRTHFNCSGAYTGIEIRCDHSLTRLVLVSLIAIYVQESGSITLLPRPGPTCLILSLRFIPQVKGLFGLPQFPHDSVSPRQTPIQPPADERSHCKPSLPIQKSISIASCNVLELSSELPGLLAISNTISFFKLDRCSRT
jgi:hypothetical protein